MSRSHVFVEKAQPEDRDELIKFMDSTPENLCDPKVFGYSSLTTLKAVKEGKPLVFLPIHTVFMLESLAICPNNGAVETATALAELVKIVRWEAVNAGHGELWFACKEASTQAFAEKHGFERVDVPMFKMRLK